jgi:cell division protein FtsL
MALNSANNTASALKTLRQTVTQGKPGPIRRLVASRYLTALFVLSLLLLAACLYIWQRVVALDLINEVSLLEETNRARRDVLMKVETDVAELSRFSRIAKIAEKKFGLKQIQPENLYAVRFGEESPGQGGMSQMWNTLRLSLRNAPSLESSTAAASEVFDERDK